MVRRLSSSWKEPDEEDLEDEAVDEEAGLDGGEGEAEGSFG